MKRRWIDHTVPACRLLIIIMVLPIAALLLQGCFSDRSNTPTCPDGLHSYKDKCLSAMSIEYVGCTEGRGFSSIDEWGVGVGGQFKAIAGASVDFARKKAQVEDTPVALQIVKDCMAIAERNLPANDPQRRDVDSFQQQVDQFTREWQESQVQQTATIKLSASNARHGAKVTVEGFNFWPNEIVNILVHASFVAQANADGKGNFSVVITVPSDVLAGFDTSITATGQTSVKSARSPFRVTS